MIGSFWNLCRACPSMPVDKLHSEYRSTYRWHEYTGPRQEVVRRPPQSNAAPATGEIMNDICHTTKAREDDARNDSSELEPLVDEKSREEKTQNAKSEFNTEYKKKFRPFSQYEYSEGRFTKKGNVNRDEVDDMGPNVSYPVYGEKGSDSWYREVVELRKKAGEYKSRGWGSDFGTEKISDIYNKQVELWDQVSRRSSLSALSLASMTHKSFTKQEKDDDNNKKTSPTKAHRNAENSARLMRDIVRHHLERTTGGSDFDGLILSPTREKLEPTIPRKDDDSRGSTKNSPKKNSPLKSSSLKRPNQKSSKSPRNVRSQSVGPTDSSNEKKSPKKQSRSATVKEKKSTANDDSTRRPRPSSLNTTASSRSKSSSVPSKNEDERLAKANSKNSLESSRQKLGSKDVRKGFSGAEPAKTESNVEEKTEEVTEEKDTIITYEPVIKSPPEPTRVKSPEQILMKSPDPVNWTVPLDTGKTFTVTQNVREGDIGSRPHSEVKAWTPPDISVPVVQSAPPSLLDQDKEHGSS